jgi:hypothetical protein
MACTGVRGCEISDERRMAKGNDDAYRDLGLRDPGSRIDVTTTAKEEKSCARKANMAQMLGCQLAK